MRKLLARAGEKAKLPFPNHPHMLRHACGCKRANDGADTGAIQHDVTPVTTPEFLVDCELFGSCGCGSIG